MHSSVFLTVEQHSLCLSSCVSCVAAYKIKKKIFKNRAAIEAGAKHPSGLPIVEPVWATAGRFPPACNVQNHNLKQKIPNLSNSVTQSLSAFSVCSLALRWIWCLHHRVFRERYFGSVHWRDGRRSDRFRISGHDADALLFASRWRCPGAGESLSGVLL